MKKIILSLIAAVACMSIIAQVIKVYDTKTSTTEPVETYTNSDAHTYKVVFEEAPADPNILTGKFTVAEGKQVQFTKGNLYWDGSAWHFEANQTDYPTTWSTSHVGHFLWTKTAAASYAQTYSDGTNNTTDKFFADGSDADHKLTVDNTEGLYALTSTEWDYLIYSRTDANYLYKYGVTVTNGGTSYTNCLIIAPDDYSGTALSEIEDWSLSNIKSLGLVCLPAAGDRYGSYLNNGESSGKYWSATPHSDNSSFAYYLIFNVSYLKSVYDNYRYYGYSVRLVK